MSSSSDSHQVWLLKEQEEEEKEEDFSSQSKKSKRERKRNLCGPPVTPDTRDKQNGDKVRCAGEFSHVQDTQQVEMPSISTIEGGKE